MAEKSAPKFSEECVAAARKIKLINVDDIPPKCKLLVKLQKWRMLRRHELSFEAGVRFLEENPGWPLRSETIPELEKLITEKTCAPVIQRWFSQHTPTTYEGVKALLKTYDAKSPEAEKIKVILAKTWAQGDLFNEAEQAYLLKKYGSLLSQLTHQRRVEFLLWKGKVALVRPLLPLLATDKRQTYLEWIKRLEKPESTRPSSTHPGLSTLDAKELIQKEKNVEAADLMMAADVKRVFELDSSFFSILQQLVRQLVLEKKHLLASDLAQKGLLLSRKQDKCRNEFLWLNGWILDQYLDSSDKAITYFIDAYKRTKVSEERAQYAFWAARAASQKHPNITQKWLRIASEYPHTFYGQLAIDRLPLKKENKVTLHIDSKKRQDFQKKELPRAIRLMSEAGQADLKNILLDGLVTSLNSPDDFEFGCALLQKYGTPYYQIHFFQEANKRYNLHTHTALYQLKLPDMGKVDEMFVHSLIFNESRFHPTIKSVKNAVGLMQITPLTATHLRNKKHAVDDARLYYDPEYHLKIGAIYLNELFQRFKQSYLLLAMAYNAGPTYTSAWLRKVGAPEGEFDTEWIESITLKETRDYVKRVLGVWLRYQHHAHSQAPFSPKELLKMYESGKGAVTK